MRRGGVFDVQSIDRWRCVRTDGFVASRAGMRSVQHTLHHYSAAVITLICNRYFFYAPLLFLSLNGQNYVFVTVHGHLSILFVCVRENSQSRRGIWMRLLEPTAYRLLNDADCRINVLRFLLGQGVRSTDCRSSGCCYVEMASAPAVPEPSDKCCPVRGSSLREIEPTLFSGKCISLSLSLSLSLSSRAAIYLLYNMRSRSNKYR